jgi:membrane-bound lytic murein transglycosylase D
VDEAVLRALNPSLKRGRVPDVRVPHMLRIPAGHYAEHAEALDRLAPPEANGRPFMASTVRFGARALRPLAPQEHSEAVAVLASRREARRQYAAQGRRVERAAPVARYAAEAPGEATAERPSVAELAAQARRDRGAAEPQPAVAAQAEPTPAETARPEPVEAAPPVRTVSTAPERPATHRVRSGENLTQIARRYGLSVARLRALNGLSSDTIRPGQRLRLDGEAQAARATPSRPSTHRVRRGENLTQIARRYGVSVRNLREWNGLRGDTIRAGQRLRLRPPGSRG